MSLLTDLRDAEKAASGDRPCPLCEYIAGLAEGPTRDALVAASSGTIGIRKLEAIFQSHEIPVGRRTITRHRNERHGAA